MNPQVERVDNALAKQQSSFEQNDLQLIEATVDKPELSSASETAPTITLEEVEQPAQLSIKPVQLSEEQLAQLKYQKGLKLQSKGELVEAREAWLKAISIQVDLHQAREQLAASYFGANDVARALAILKQGIVLFPDYEGYRLLGAQIHYQQQQVQLALDMLQQPYLKATASIHALSLAGSLAQQLTLWPQAQQSYQKLVELEPGKAQWLIGLAIALDAQGQTAQALVFYMKLLVIPNLDKSLYDYAVERVKLLQRDQNG
ncbi:hypothetical protein CW748_09670 [Alteromonadales bacterium alter-6D02]|nr:hypothetical protein CW748_09670 [Alteromonadales bacterium alter-6D02]